MYIPIQKLQDLLICSASTIRLYLHRSDFSGVVDRDNYLYNLTTKHIDILFNLIHRRSRKHCNPTRLSRNIREAKRELLSSSEVMKTELRNSL